MLNYHQLEERERKRNQTFIGRIKSTFESIDNGIDKLSFKSIIIVFVTVFAVNAIIFTQYPRIDQEKHGNDRQLQMQGGIPQLQMQAAIPPEYVKKAIEASQEGAAKGGPNAVMKAMAEEGHIVPAEMKEALEEAGRDGARGWRWMYDENRDMYWKGKFDAVKRMDPIPVERPHTYYRKLSNGRKALLQWIRHPDENMFWMGYESENAGEYRYKAFGPTFRPAYYIGPHILDAEHQEYIRLPTRLPVPGEDRLTKTQVTQVWQAPPPREPGPEETEETAHEM